MGRPISPLTRWAALGYNWRLDRTIEQAMSRPRSRWNTIAVILCFFLLLGGIEGLSLYLATVRAGRPVQAWRLLTGTFPSLVMQLALTWPVALVSRHARLGPGTGRGDCPSTWWAPCCSRPSL